MALAAETAIRDSKRLQQHRENNKPAETPIHVNSQTLTATVVEENTKHPVANSRSMSAITVNR